ncbi:hypothetical protein MNBD_BACTEROID03-1564 [hydrothermal vent metagenome]|uniref:Uncharacterized protein n=1 Tax=hydrothermal vent metagenome TaxID=652676 RepID=A0A3B0TGG7_9ZZZZ
MPTSLKPWLPIVLSDTENGCLSQLYKFLDQNDQKLDLTLWEQTDQKINFLFKSYVNTIVDRNSLPNISHLICGWGDFEYEGGSITDKLADFIFYKDGKPYIKQCDPEGDFHPWQSFAYMVMAGVDFQKKIVGTHSLQDVVSNSIRIQKDKGEELGHLLFAFASVAESDWLDHIFYMNEKQYTLQEMVRKAIYAHEYGGFEVCRKFHLSEGLCAISARVPAFEKFKEEAERFLDGQTKMVDFILIVLEQILSEKSQISVIKSLRDKLVILDYFENHIYYLGHAIENACFGLINGFTMEKRQFRAITRAINIANSFLSDFGLASISFLESFLSLGHYRRAVTLFTKLNDSTVEVEGQRIGLILTTNLKLTLQEYTVDLKSLKGKPGLKPEIVSDAYKDYFLYFDTEYDILPKLKSIIEHTDLQDTNIVLKGGFKHFRRYHPAEWPRSVHYEILQHKNKTIGLEIHIEDQRYQSLYPVLERLSTKLPELCMKGKVSLDREWYSCGRLKIDYDLDVPNDVIVKDFLRFIGYTETILAQPLKAIT